MAPRVSIRVAEPASFDTPFLIVPVVSSGGLPSELGSLDAISGGQIARAFESGDFSAKRDETLLVYPASGPRRVLLVGMGEVGADRPGNLRRAAMVGGKRARMAGVPSAACMAPVTGIASAVAGQLLAEGLPFGAWHYPDLRRPADPPKPPLESLELLIAEDDAAFAAGVERGSAVAAGQQLTRGIQVLPADTCTPEYLAGRAREIADRHGFRITVLDRSQLEAEGMRAILAVGQGSANEPRFIAIEYRGSDDAPTVLVGKGVTFDTGGISIKPAQGMEDMKFDMSGAAAVLGTFELLGRLRPACHVIGLIPSAENMVSGSSYRPGDVVRAHSGKTIEVVNTDAEGRLLLADALSWARRYQPAAVVDCATLTGAVVIGLGHTATAVMGTSDELVGRLREAGERSGERLWELPLWDDYRDLIKSDIADMKNSGGRPAGTISAAWFLKEFAEDYPWAHLDIAGTAYTDREHPTQVKGPTGILVRLFAEFLLAGS